MALSGLPHAALGLFFAAAAFGAPAFGEGDLHVSAKNPVFEDHFAGSMIVEVVVRDPAARDLGRSSGEPDVSVNGKTLRMVQGADGAWYAYFANRERAQHADQIMLESGASGVGLDFGVFCGRDTAPDVFGIGLSDTDGFAVPTGSGLSGFTEGLAPFAECTGSPDSSEPSSVVRRPKAINTNPNVPVGQTGLNANAWPLIQLFSFGDVAVSYNPGGPSQTIRLEYDDVPNVGVASDRDAYPAGSEVFLTIHDMQLNQDPTDRDSWTFGAGDGHATFYRAFDDGGSRSADGGSGLVDLLPHLSALGFERNGRLELSLDSILSLKTNRNQPSPSVGDGMRHFEGIVTFVETGPNTGIFTTGDSGNESVLATARDAPRGRADHVAYGGKSISLLSASETASVQVGTPAITVGAGQALSPGTRIPITIHDGDQNVNSNLRDTLDASLYRAAIPTLTVGAPLTLAGASDVRIYGPAADSSGVPVPSAIDETSSRLLIDTSDIFERISVNLGVSLDPAVLADPATGTNWLNYDLRSLGRHLGLDDLSDTRISIHSGSPDDPEPITIAEAGQLGRLYGLVQLDAEPVRSALAKSGTAFAVIDFDASEDSVMAAGGRADRHAIILDIFSFDMRAGDKNNAVYRFELSESAADSGVFEGTLEYFVANQLGVGPAEIGTLRTIDEDVRFLVTRSVTDEGIRIHYADLADAGVNIVTSFQADATTHTGTVGLDGTSYGFGRPVTVTLNDPDLNADHGRLDTHAVIDDPASAWVDTVGTPAGDTLLEISIKGVRYQRCVIDGTEYGGLADSGFALAETSPSSGVFTGVFKMPSQICDGSGTGLITTAGGSIDVRYFDFRDSDGGQSIATLSGDRLGPVHGTSVQLNSHSFWVPAYQNTADVIVTGSIAGRARGSPAELVLTHPDGTTQSFAARLTDSGRYKAVFYLNSGSQTGTYGVDVMYGDSQISSASFAVADPVGVFGDDVMGWSSGAMPDSSFRDALGLLAQRQALNIGTPSSDEPIPSWIKKASGLWLEGLIPDDQYLRMLEFLISRDII